MGPGPPDPPRACRCALGAHLTPVPPPGFTVPATPSAIPGGVGCALPTAFLALRGWALGFQRVPVLKINRGSRDVTRMALGPSWCIDKLPAYPQQISFFLNQIQK